jgi:propanol-preferring alcohol dehydrogenase
VANSTRQDGIELISLAARMSLKTEIEKFSLEEANTVLKKLKERSLRAAGVLSING